MGDLVSLFAYMDAQKGVGESPPGSNVVILRDGTNLWRDIYGYQPPASQAPWCALFQSTCELKNGTPLPAIDFPHGYVGVDNGRAWFRSHGLLVPAPKPGYLVFYNEHTGRVRSLNADGTFWSLEGNEGDAVRLVLRHPSEVVGGFGVREYASTPDPVPEEEDEPVNLQPGQPCQTIDVTGKRLLSLVSDQGGSVRVAIGVGPANLGTGGWAWGPQEVKAKGPDPAVLDLSRITGQLDPGQYVIASLTITDDTKNAVGVSAR